MTVVQPKRRDDWPRLTLLGQAVVTHMTSTGRGLGVGGPRRGQDLWWTSSVSLIPYGERWQAINTRRSTWSRCVVHHTYIGPSGDLTRREPDSQKRGSQNRQPKQTAKADSPRQRASLTARLTTSRQRHHCRAIFAAGAFWTGKAPTPHWPLSNPSHSSSDTARASLTLLEALISTHALTFLVSHHPGR